MTQSTAEKIRDRGYWRVAIRPTEFEQVRVGNILDLKKILESVSVNLRGWDFPHIDHKYETEIGQDWIGQHVDWEMYVEYWRFYQSGQFVHLDGFKEDWTDQVEQLSIEKREQGKLFEAVNAVYRFNEIFELAGRLASTEAGGNSTNIEIGLFGLKGRKLWVSSATRVPFDDRYTTSMPEFRFEREYSQAELADRAGYLAIEHSTELFRRFNWDAPPEVLQSMLEKLKR